MPMSLFSNVFQMAYVTNEIERAAARFRDRYGCGNFQINHGVPDGALTMSLGLAYAGRTNIELIQPDPAGHPLYAKWIADADGFVVRFHHVCALVETAAEWQELRAGFNADGTPIVLEGLVPDTLEYLYADTTPDLGHYLEYVRLDAGGRAMFEAVPGFPGFAPFG